MKRFIMAATCTLLATSALAAPKFCEELKAEIEAKIGSCDNGTKKIIYQLNGR
ncbi:hypothetical protein IBL38_20055 [Pseudomonas syringae pv. syringae]|uniref:hypothetical protein n=1 Tax=Pseudomonas syringae TaxID=317 RepID=UPI001658F35B|nr:hypothetical protein [Pseudomonas syringae]MBC9749586.1 hypothetical protein [Pseudomonas syringae pv. syringae]